MMCVFFLIVPINQKNKAQLQYKYKFQELLACLSGLLFCCTVWLIIADAFFNDISAYADYSDQEEEQQELEQQASGNEFEAPEQEDGRQEIEDSVSVSSSSSNSYSAGSSEDSDSDCGCSDSSSNDDEEYNAAYDDDDNDSSDDDEDEDEGMRQYSLESKLDYFFKHLSSSSSSSQVAPAMTDTHDDVAAHNELNGMMNDLQHVQAQVQAGHGHSMFSSLAPGTPSLPSHGGHGYASSEEIEEDEVDSEDSEMILL